MKIELKKFKYLARASHESTCFEAEVWIDGKKAGWAENQGQGGHTICGPNTLDAAFREFAKDLPETDEYLKSSGYLIDDMVFKLLMENDLRKVLKKRVLVTIKGSSKIRETKCLSQEVMARAMSDMPKFTARIGDVDKVLNVLPFDEAFKIYCAAISPSP